jgi:hypothetical protein
MVAVLAAPCVTEWSRGRSLFTVANQRISRCPNCQVADWSYYLVSSGDRGVLRYQESLAQKSLVRLAALLNTVQDKLS